MCAAFLANSRRARSLSPCLTLKQCCDLAVEVLRKNRRSAIFPPMRDIAASNGLLKPGQASAIAQPYDGSFITKAGQLAKRGQGALRQVGPGGYGPGTHINLPGAIPRQPTPRIPKVAGGLQVCPAFSKAAPCPRGGDSKGSCMASSGTKLHHICAICASPSHCRVNHK